MKEKIYDLALEVLKDYPALESWTFSRNELEQFASLIVKECITAVKNTDRTHAYTTFDKSLIDGTIEKSIKSIKQHLKM
jgi:hypothetical protein